MSNREKAVAMLDSFSDDQLVNVIAMLQTMKHTIEAALTPNATTIAALKEGDEMLRTGSGQSWAGSTKELFQQILDEDG